MNGNMIKTVAGIVVVALGALGIIDVREHRETNRKIDMSMKDIQKAAEKDITAAMLEKAVQNAAKEMTGTFMQSIKDSVMDEAKNKLTDAAKDAVREASADIKLKVGDKVSEEVSKIDISELKKSARDKAEEKILNKFDGNLEDLLEKFNDNLGNIQKIYGGIADAISKGNDRDKGLKFTIG